jgi:response regulator RpfG family c-di-GMP phosphodiesterase
VETKALVGLIDACVSDFDSDGLAELIAQLRADLPRLLKSPDHEVFDQLVQAARLIAFSRHPEPVSECVDILLDIAAAHLPRGKSSKSLPLVERALDLAEDNDLKSHMRRACNFYSSLSIDAGNPARGVEYAIRAALLARELGDEHLVAAAFSNMTAALCMMGMYRETISVALRVIKRFKDDPRCSSFVAGARGNLANAALAMQHYALTIDAAEIACKNMGLPHDGHGVLNRAIAENTWMRGAIGLDLEDVVAERLKMIRSLADAYKSPRLQINCQLAEAAAEIYSGNLTVATAKLLELLNQSKSVPGLYRENLVLLVRAYEKGNDHAGALIYLGELVDCLGKSQVTAVHNALEAIRERVQTPMPGKDDARALIKLIQTVPSAHREEVKVPESQYRDAMERLAVTAELREDAHGRHAYRVGKLTGLLTKALGYGYQFCDEMDLASRLHDIGKLGIPDGLLMKPGKLTSAEFTVMQRHTTIGAQLLAQCTHPAFRLAEQIALCHHEKWDGTGYPKGLKGENIPEAARIATLADVYDALTHARAYKHAWTHDESVMEIERMSGTHFEPRVVKAFVKLITNLRLEHGDALDDFLAKAGEDSTFIQARDKMQTMLSEMESLDPGELL